jgi:hypothetical protein
LVITMTWASLGFLSLLLAALTALLILVFGAMIHASLTSGKRS